MQSLDIVLSGNGCVTLGRSTTLSEPLLPSSRGGDCLDQLGILLKGRFWLSGSGWGLRFCIPNTLQGDATAAGLPTTLEEQGLGAL